MEASDQKYPRHHPLLSCDGLTEWGRPATIPHNGHAFRIKESHETQKVIDQEVGRRRSVQLQEIYFVWPPLPLRGYTCRSLII